MIFDLVRDFANALAAMPAEQPRRCILKLLDEAIRRDGHFIERQLHRPASDDAVSVPLEFVLVVQLS